MWGSQFYRIPPPRALHLPFSDLALPFSVTLPPAYIIIRVPILSCFYSLSSEYVCIFYYSYYYYCCYYTHITSCVRYACRIQATSLTTTLPCYKYMCCCSWCWDAIVLYSLGVPTNTPNLVRESTRFTL